MSDQVESHDDREPRPVYLSFKTRQRLADEYLESIGAGEGYGSRFGLANYTYEIVADRFRELLSSHGVAAMDLDRPEIYNLDTVPGKNGNKHTPIHLIFKPAEEIRVLRGAYNIGMIYWEFDKILENRNARPDYNQRRMLGLLDEIWVANHHLLRVITAAGFRNVYVVPCPVDFPHGAEQATDPLVENLGGLPAATLADRAAARISTLRQLLPPNAGSTDAPLVLSVANPFDHRKDLKTLLSGFRRLPPMGNRRPTLLIKLVVDNKRRTLAGAVEMINNWFEDGFEAAPTVIAISATLTTADLAHLYRASAFYLTCSRAEGQNLPLIEAMQCRCLPISPAHTAMGDYVRADSAIVLPAQLKRAGASSNAFGSTDLFWYQVDPDDIASGLHEALTMPVQERERLASNAERIARDSFSGGAVWKTVEARFRAAA